MWIQLGVKHFISLNEFFISFLILYKNRKKGEKMNHPKHYFRCKYLDWHRPASIEYHDAVNAESKCKYCGRSIMEDSQGNWFTYLKPEYDTIKEEYK